MALDTILDTLEVTSDYTFSKTHESLVASAIGKGKQIQKLKQLIDVSSPKRQKQYWKTYHCDRVKLQQGQKIVGSLCRKRWCNHCNRIKTKELIHAYKDPLKDLGDLYFVTLTAPTVKARQLKSELNKRYKAFTNIKDNIRKNYKTKIHGIRKTEVTYNEQKDHYHPHFHLIVKGFHEAQLIQSLWLNQFSKASIKAQDIKPIDMANDKSLVEVFKYATKDVTKDKTSAKAMDNIYRALEGIRTIQTYGSIRKVKEPKEEKEVQNLITWKQPTNDIWVYDEKEKDYLNAYNDRLLYTNDVVSEIINKSQKTSSKYLNKYIESVKLNR